MGRFNNHHQYWDEFRWEEEIRRDERRISGYFRELAGCIDLPDEEELIYDQLAGQSDLVPTQECSENLRNFFFGEEEDEDEISERGQMPRRTVENATVDELDMLCSEWNILTVSRLPHSARHDALVVSCAFAKLLARLSDFMEPDNNSAGALLISLGKRSLRDLNETVTVLNSFGSKYAVMLPETDEFISRLGEIRERVISRIQALR